MSEQIPDWAQDLTVSEAEQIAPKIVGTDAKRIEAARRLAIQSARWALEQEGWSEGPRADFFKEYNGNPSTWDGQHLYVLAGLIRTQLNGKELPLGGAESYSATTGIFATLGGFPVTALREAFDARIAELGISEVLLEEWNVTPRDWRQSNAWHALPFEERMKTYRRAHERRRW